LIYKQITKLVFSLNPLDIEVMKKLGSRVNLIPVVAKADTLTPTNLEKFKQNV
jgi:cell division control protein 12